MVTISPRVPGNALQSLRSLLRWLVAAVRPWPALVPAAASKSTSPTRSSDGSVSLSASWLRRSKVEANNWGLAAQDESAHALLGDPLPLLVRRWLLVAIHQEIDQDRAGGQAPDKPVGAHAIKLLDFPSPALNGNFPLESFL